MKSQVLENQKLKKQEEGLAITKRDGTVVPFCKERVFRSVEAAFRISKSISHELPFPPNMGKVVDRITEQVITKLLTLEEEKMLLTVEEIQNLVETELIDQGFHEVAHCYITYRDSRGFSQREEVEQIEVYCPSENRPIRFNPIRIASSLGKVFQQVHPLEQLTSQEFVEVVGALTQRAISEFLLIAKTTKRIPLHRVEEVLERMLMRSGYFHAAKHYILSQAKKSRRKDEESPLPKRKRRRIQKENERQFQVITREGEKKVILESALLDRIDYACSGVEDLVEAEELLAEVSLNFYDGEMKEEEVDQTLIMVARSRVERDPVYAKVASRLLLDKIYRETIKVEATHPELEMHHRDYFKQYIQRSIASKRLSPALESFNLDTLSQVIDLTRDDKFLYLGLQTLFDRYFIHEEERRVETPQIFWMRVAMGLALQEQDKMKKAIEFYHVLSRLYYLPSTPTLFNAGTTHPQLSSCYVSTVGDSLENIFKTISDNAKLSKWAGGLGNDWTNVRGTGSYIKGTNGKSQGVIPFLKVANDTAVAVNQGGKRRGAACAYLETWHIDFEEFLELRKNTGDERRRTHDMSTANWIPDLFMKRVRENGKWTLFSPHQVPDLHDLWGKAFEKRYIEYEERVARGKPYSYKEVEARTLWRKMLSMLFETGHPWIAFKDPANIRSPQNHVGVIHSSNLCTEILLNTSEEEVAVCNLGSVNLVAHVTPQGLNEKRLARTVRTAMRMLDNVIDINFYPIPEAEKTNLTHRPVGLGIMGFQDALHILGLSYASNDAVDFADYSMEIISYYAILSSSHLAKERNPYPSYKGSRWEHNVIPIDTIDLLEEERGEKVYMDRSMRMDWGIVREHIRKHGMRNSHTLAIAPTATLANIAGVSASIEPNYNNLYVKSNLSGEFTICNPYLVKELKELGLWDEEMLDELKCLDGSIAGIERIPPEIKQKYLTAFEIEPRWIIESGSRRQKWIDQAQSLNLYFAQSSGKELDQMFQLIWSSGLKTTYYLRALGATKIEKTTIDVCQKKVRSTEKNPSLSSLHQRECEACQ